MIEKDSFKVFLANTGTECEVPFLKKLKDLSDELCPVVKDRRTGAEFPVLAALVDHKLKELDYKLAVSHEVEFIGYNHPDGRRTYLRSLCFVLQNAVRVLYPDKVLIINHSLPSGLYCTICKKEPMEDGRRDVIELDDNSLSGLKAEMRNIISRDLPFTKVKMEASKAEEIFIANNQPDKAALLKSLGVLICSVYYLDGQADTFHGPLLPSTGYLKVFDLMPYGEGFCLQFPSDGDYNRLIPVRKQSGIASTLKDYADWCNHRGQRHRNPEQGHP